MAKIRVVVADDHRLIVEGLRRVLEATEDFEIVGEAITGKQLIPLVGRTQPDVVVTDLRMPGLDGLSALQEIRRRAPDVKVVVLSMISDPDQIQSALNRGASAYIVKSVNPLDLPSALRQVVEGSVYMTLGLPPNGQHSGKAAGLTERETTILKALARGLSNQAIAKELWVAPQTVKFHLANIYRKLGVSNRTEATRYAYREGLVDSPLYDIE